MNQEPLAGTVYRRNSDGKRFRFNGRPGLARPDFYAGWEANGPDVYGKLVGDAWGWPYGYEVDPDQSWVDQEIT
jgi:hypothetical protein